MKPPPEALLHPRQCEATSEQAHLLVGMGLGLLGGAPRLPPLLSASLGAICWRRSSHTLPGGCSAVAFLTPELQSCLSILGRVVFYKCSKKKRWLCFNLRATKYLVW